MPYKSLFFFGLAGQKSWTLLEANEVNGPYTTNNAASPYTNSPTGEKKSYRVIVK